MIYINLNNLCEFGNLLFAICNGLSLCFKYNINLNMINFIDYKINRKIPITIYEMFNKLSYIENVEINSNCIELYEPLKYNYNEIHLNIKNDYIITGNFCSYKYFNEYINQIKSYLNIKQNNNQVNLINNDKIRIGIFIKKSDLNLHIYIESLKSYINSKSTDESTNLVYDITIITNNKNFNLEELNLDYEINLIKETNQEKIFYLMLDFDHYIIPNSNLALISYYFRSKKNATIHIPEIWSLNLTSYQDLIENYNCKLDVMCKLDNTYIINLESRVDRKYHSVKEVSKISNNPIIFKAIKNNYGPYGASLSHISVLKNAIKNNLEYVCII